MVSVVMLVAALLLASFIDLPFLRELTAASFVPAE
jgi:hypothetical protein